MISGQPPAATAGHGRPVSTRPCWGQHLSGGQFLSLGSGLQMSLEFPAVRIQVSTVRAELAGDGLLLALCPSCHDLLGSGHFFGVRSGDALYLDSFCEAAMSLPALNTPARCPALKPSASGSIEIAVVFSLFFFFSSTWGKPTGHIQPAALLMSVQFYLRVSIYPSIRTEPVIPRNDTQMSP